MATATTTATRPKKVALTAMMVSDERLAAAVKEIEKNCGPGMRHLLSGYAALTAKEIVSLSNASSEYQHHVLARIRAGHANALNKTAACALVYETVGFYEVVNRMERALGEVRLEASFIAGQIDTNATELNRGSDRLVTLALVIESIKGIREIIQDLPTVPPPKVKKKNNKPKKKSAPVVSDELNAARGLGLLAKNNRNLPMLKPEHHPTAKQSRRALDLCSKIAGVAEPALRSAQERWGRLDDQLWLRSPGSTRRIITHDNPDGDAIVSAWLAERFLFADEKVDILFVPRGRALGCLRPGDCLVDVGKTHDPARFLFDHKPPALPSRHDSCAAMLVWEHLLDQGKPVQHLKPLILAVLAWDSFKRRKEFFGLASASKQTGFHAVLDTAKQQGLNNVALYRDLRSWLDQRWG